MKSQSFTSVRAKSYPTHNPTFSTPNGPQVLAIKEIGKALRMKFAAILTALSIGFIAGLTFNPPKTVEIAETQIQLRREISGDST